MARFHRFPTAATPPGAAHARAEHGPVRILLVEDHEDTCLALAYLLEHEGYVVAPAHSLRQALAIGEHADFHVIVSDLGLPDGSGLDLMRTMRARKPLGGIALTGSGSHEDLAETRAAGFACHLTKPVDVAALVAAIERVRIDRS